MAQSENGLRLVVGNAVARSGLMDDLAPRFRKAHKIPIKLSVAAGAGAVELARTGKADVLILSDEALWRRGLKAGVLTARRDVMFGEIVILGPPADPAGIKGMTSAIDAVKLIASAEAPFLSRGDSGTIHHIERGIWEEAGVETKSVKGPEWYADAKAGMVETIKRALAKKAYTLSDQATWLSLERPKGLVVLVRDDPRMVVQFSATLVNPRRIKGIDAAGGRAFIKWITSKNGQKAINEYKLAGGYPFTANYGQRRTD